MENTWLIWVIVNQNEFGTTLVKAYATKEEAEANLCDKEYVDWVELVIDNGGEQK